MYTRNTVHCAVKTELFFLLVGVLKMTPNPKTLPPPKIPKKKKTAPAKYSETIVGHLSLKAFFYMRSSYI